MVFKDFIYFVLGQTIIIKKEIKSHVVVQMK